MNTDLEALGHMRKALAEFNEIEATDHDGLETCNAGIGLALAVDRYLWTLDRKEQR